MLDIQKMDKCRHLLPEPGPEVVGECIEEIKELRDILAILSSIFFYGNFISETFNEKRLEEKLKKFGFWANTEEELMTIIMNNCCNPDD